MSSSNNTDSKATIITTRPWHISGTLLAGSGTFPAAPAAYKTWAKADDSEMLQKYLLVHKGTKRLYLSAFSPEAPLMELPEMMIIHYVDSEARLLEGAELRTKLVLEYKLIGTVGQLLQYLAVGYKSE